MAGRCCERGAGRARPAPLRLLRGAAALSRNPPCRRRDPPVSLVRKPTVPSHWAARLSRKGDPSEERASRLQVPRDGLRSTVL
jgi:hypothetical protein